MSLGKELSFTHALSIQLLNGYQKGKLLSPFVALICIWNGEFKRDIFHDIDGSFMGTAGGWLTRYYPHLITNACTKLADEVTFGGPVITCQNTIKLRKFNLYNLKPTVLQNTPLEIANASADLDDDANYTSQIHK